MCSRTLSKNENNVGTWAPEHLGTCLFSTEQNSRLEQLRDSNPVAAVALGRRFVAHHQRMFA